MNPTATPPPGPALLDGDADPNELDPREWTNSKASTQAARASAARHQKSGRRGFVDPTTCERDYSDAEMDSDAEMELMQTMQEYKRRSGRMFPTWSEVLEVLQSLGYMKVAPPAGSFPHRRPEQAGRP